MFILQFFFILIIIVAVFVIVLVSSIIFRFWSMFRVLFGLTKRTTSQNEWHNTNESSSSHSQTKTRTSVTPDTRKIFSKDEGEYVDFEEIP